MSAKSIIEKKRDGHPLTASEIEFMTAGAVDGSVEAYHLTAWMMAIYFQGMSNVEIADLTRAMIDSGRRIARVTSDFIPVDKHSTGGVGDKLSFLVAPLVASYGVPVPMISGRSLGHTGGTLDKLESIPGYRTALHPDEFRSQVERIGVAIAGQSDDLVPADRKLYALRDAASIVESIPLITGSILSKKVAEGAGALVFDVKVGGGAFMTDRERGRKLAQQLVSTAGLLGVRARAYLTAMDDLLGDTAGNALEVAESIRSLTNGPQATAADVREVTLALASGMLELAGRASNREDGERLVLEAWRSGRGLEKFRELIETQGGDPRVCDDPTRLPAARRTLDIVSPRSGVVHAIDARQVGIWITESGGGRVRMGQQIDPVVGVERLCATGAAVRAGDPVLRLHLSDREIDEPATVAQAESWIHIEPAVQATSLVLEVIE